MERRAFLAVLLSVVAIVFWYTIFPPSPGVQGEKERKQVGGVAERVTGERESVEKGDANSKEVVRGELEEEVLFGGEGFQALVTSRGAVLRSWKLARYKDETGRPQELVGEGPTPLSVYPSGPWNQELWQVTREGEVVVMRWADGQGRWLEKRFVAGGGYGLEVRVRGGGFGRDLAVVVSGGLASWGKEGKGSGFARAGFVGREGGKVKRVSLGKGRGEEVKGQVNFLGAEDQYFLLALVPSTVTRGELLGQEGVVLAEGREEVSGLLIGVPKEHRLLKTLGHGLEETLSFGFFGFFSLVFLSVLRWIHGWSGNWGVGIVLLTAGIRVLLFPLTHKSTIAMRRMGRLQPKIKAIQERYEERAKRDVAVRQRMNQEILELYRREGVNPMGGCLPMLVQIPILWALYSLFAFAIELRHQPFILWIKDLSAKDPTYITPILMTASMVVQQRLAPQAGDPAQRRMFMILPFVFGFMFMNFPSGLVLYWLVNNLLTIGQQLLTERLLQRAGSES